MCFCVPGLSLTQVPGMQSLEAKNNTCNISLQFLQRLQLVLMHALDTTAFFYACSVTMIDSHYDDALSISTDTHQII